MSRDVGEEEGEACVYFGCQVIPVGYEPGGIRTRWDPKPVGSETGGIRNWWDPKPVGSEIGGVRNRCDPKPEPGGIRNPSLCRHASSLLRILLSRADPSEWILRSRADPSEWILLSRADPSERILLSGSF